MALPGWLLLLGAAFAASEARSDDTLAPSLQQQLAEQSREAVARGNGAKGLDHKGEPQLLRAFQDSDGSSHVHWRATVDGVPVWGGDYIAHHDGEGALTSVTPPRVPVYARSDGRANANADGSAAVANGYVGSLPLVSEAQALQAARVDAAQHGHCLDCETMSPQADLWVLVVDDEPRLAWRVRQFLDDGGGPPALPVRFVDALDGTILAGYDNLQTARAPKSPARTGTGNSLYSGSVSFADAYANGKYFLEDLGRTIGTLEAVGPAVDNDNYWLLVDQAALVDAHWGAQRWFDYMLQAHGRHGVLGVNRGPGYYAMTQPDTLLLKQRAHYSNSGEPWSNASWNGTEVVYGDGDGTEFSPFVTLDIVGHEWTHAVTEHTAGLIYENESGALNESISDVFGELVERSVRGETATSWLVAEECITPGVAGDALRSMENPHSKHREPEDAFTVDDDPDHYSERYIGDRDAGGVHVNSGIANKAFHLVAKGGFHHRGGSMSGIGADDAGRIWYRALTTYMTSSTNFAAASLATRRAAVDLFGPDSAQAGATRRAWCLVGVNPAANCPIPVSDEPNLLANGSFEGRSSTPWVLSGGAKHIAPGAYPHSGDGYLVLGGSDSANDAVYQQLTLPAFSASETRLTFWFSVDSAELISRQRSDLLIAEVRSSTGALLRTLATYSDLDRAPSTGVYQQSASFNLSQYRGQTLRIQFRASTDASRKTTFRLDDVLLQ